MVIPIGFIEDDDFLPTRRQSDLFLCEALDSVPHHINTWCTLSAKSKRRFQWLYLSRHLR